MTPQPSPTQDTGAPGLNVQNVLDASRNRMAAMTQLMSAHGFVFDPVNGQFIRDPNFLDPTQQMQLKILQQQYQPNPAISAQQGAGEAAAQNAQQTGSIIPDNQLQQFINPGSGQAPAYGTTFGQAQGKQVVTPEQTQELNGLNQAYGYYQQLKDASTQVNTGKTNYAPTQLLHAVGMKVGVDKPAIDLNTLRESMSNLFSSGALNINRFNSGEQAILRGSGLPDVTDSQTTAKEKLAKLKATLDAAKNRITSQPLQSESPDNQAGPAVSAPSGLPSFDQFITGSSAGGQ